MENNITREELKLLFNYDKTNGNLLWKVGNNRRVKDGDKAGTLKDGYIRINFKNKGYYAHRLIWLYEYGYYPVNQIDHINGNKTDNRISNLREATNSENCRNQFLRSTNTSGYKGVCLNKKSNRWVASITVDGKQTYLGTFDDPYEAHLAYQKLSTKYFGEFVNFG